MARCGCGLVDAAGTFQGEFRHEARFQHGRSSTGFCSMGGRACAFSAWTVKHGLLQRGRSSMCVFSMD
eukprot:358668-Chlamydomonas_euryale.AAC.1